MFTLESKSNEFMLQILRALTTHEEPRGRVPSWKDYDIDPTSFRRVQPIANRNYEDHLGGVEFKMLSVPGHTIQITHDRGALVQFSISAEPGATRGTHVGITRRIIGNIQISRLPIKLRQIVREILEEERRYGEIPTDTSNL